MHACFKSGLVLQCMHAKNAAWCCIARVKSYVHTGLFRLVAAGEEKEETQGEEQRTIWKQTRS